MKNTDYKPERLQRGRVRTAMIALALSLGMTLVASPALAGEIGVGSGDNSSPGPAKPVPGPKPPKDDGTPGGNPNPRPVPTQGILKIVKTTVIDLEVNNALAVLLRGSALEQCPPPAVGASIKHSWQQNLDKGIQVPGSSKIISVSCIYPYVTEWTETCTVSSTATVDQVKPTTSRLNSATDTSAWGRGDRSLDACRSSHTYAYVNATPTVFGKYKAAASTLVNPVTVRKTVNPISGSSKVEIVHVGGAYQTNAKVALGELSCTGWQNSWSGKNSWSMSDCGPGTPNTQYQCSPSGEATSVNGQGSLNVTVMRDGDSNIVEWQKRVPTGNFSATGPGSTSVTREGTPWNTTSANQPAGKNDVMLYSADGRKSLLKSKSGTGVMLGSTNVFDFRAVWASNAGAPTVLKPHWNIPGTTKVNSIVIEGFDSATGQFRTRPVETTVETTASCSGDEVSFEIVRPITTGGF